MSVPIIIHEVYFVGLLSMSYCATNTCSHVGNPFSKPNNEIPYILIDGSEHFLASPALLPIETGIIVMTVIMNDNSCAPIAYVDNNPVDRKYLACASSHASPLPATATTSSLFFYFPL